jgi:uncharacterized protein (TIGR02118 family)
MECNKPNAYRQAATRSQKMLVSATYLDVTTFVQVPSIPMAQILVLYNAPADPAAFDKYYFETHAPIARKIPGLRGMHFSKGVPMAIAGSAPHLVVRLDFDSMADVQAALGSPEGQATAADLANFAHTGATVVAFDTFADQ